ncbi:hypothetical protein ACFOWU_04465 [Epilithonimonas zeae]|uniref:Tissue inhibitor of metalloproteinase n=1 Tax=Epilithonimonas zeae TaxID=1416779 RepID=A0A1N6EYV3_9FLAO|nr:hypothetical protein [Epilithonimonas zeae]SIN88228.1 hypothetical protein SAMN05444409_0940 [Epilithonimonas zeae]
MKIKFLLILIFLSVKFSACKCQRDVIAQDYFDSDVAGIITIESTYGNEERNDIMSGVRIYRAKISFDKLYKGNKFEELVILGSTTNARSGGCEKLVKAGEKYLLLTNKNQNGEYVMSLCSSMYKIYDNNLNEVNKYSKQFHYLKKNKNLFKDLKFVDYEDKSEGWNNIEKNTTNEFESVFGKQIKNKFGVYKVKIDSENNIVEIQSIKKIGINERKMLTLIKKNIRIEENPNSEYLLFLDF